MKQRRPFPRVLLIVGALAVLIAGSVAALRWSKDRWELNERRHRLGTLQLLCRLYADDHGGVMPPSLQALFPRYLNSEIYLAYAEKEVNYFPGLTAASNPASWLLQEKQADDRGRRWMGTLDMSLQLIRPGSPPPIHP